MEKAHIGKSGFISTTLNTARLRSPTKVGRWVGLWAFLLANVERRQAQGARGYASEGWVASTPLSTSETQQAQGSEEESSLRGR